MPVDAIANVIATLEAAREDLVELSAALVAAPSVNPPGDTRLVAEVVRAALAQRGFAPRLEALNPTMPSVLAELDSGSAGPHLIFNCHLDTMPAGDEAQWTVPALELTRRDGRLYGLGMGNMKGSVAAMVASLTALREVRDAWCGRITLVAVSDEVVFGDNGAAHLLEAFPDLLGDAVICGEGAGFKRVSTGEKGVLWLRVDASGVLGHSSKARRGEGAVVRLARLIAAVDELNGERPDLPESLSDLEAGEDDYGFRLTVNAGTISGGTFVGQCATNAFAEFDLRVPPGMTIDGVEARVRAIAARFDGLAVSRMKGWDPNWTSAADGLVGSWMRAALAVSGERTPIAIRQPASDASRWRTRGIPAVCFGPQPYNSVDVDDFAEEDELVRCAQLFTVAALDYLAKR